MALDDGFCAAFVDIGVGLPFLVGLLLGCSARFDFFVADPGSALADAL